mmetsp:Transcript_45720/g.97620  ORF Transcript_45720/g.97620 Transcript_45720/m.97620 type:complete len:469 (-) Transcript_45720:429-1835(-)
MGEDTCCEPGEATLRQRQAGATQKEYTMAEVAKHSSKGDAWIVVDGGVYNVGKWMHLHPGGELAILGVAGKDCSVQYTAFHPEEVRERLEKFRIGTAVDWEQNRGPIDKDYMKLHEDLKAKGYFAPSYLYYFGKFAWYGLLLAISLACVFLSETSVVRWAIGGFFMAAFWQQVAFFGHDIGHRTVTFKFWPEYYVGMIAGNFLTGISIGWWKATHNVHHIVTNSLEYDPDVQHLPIFAVDSRFFQSLYSQYHFWVMEFKHSRVSQLLVSQQHRLYLPIMAFARFNLYVQGLILLCSKRGSQMRGVQHRGVELALLAGFLAWYSALVSQLPDWNERLGFVLVSHAFAGILHVQITISHFPMPCLEGRPADSMDFVRHQLKTSLDVDCPRVLDWFHGGLQFQVAHHLFPRIPRRHLREVRGMIEERICKPHKLTYHSDTFTGCVSEVHRTLQKTADKTHPYLKDMFMMNG